MIQISTALECGSRPTDRNVRQLFGETLCQIEYSTKVNVTVSLSKSIVGYPSVMLNSCRYPHTSSHFLLQILTDTFVYEVFDTTLHFTLFICS